MHNLVAWHKRLTQLRAATRRRERWRVDRPHALQPECASAICLEAMRDRRIQAIQVPYNPLERGVEATILPAAADLGLGVIVMRPFGEGSLMRARVAGAALWRRCAPFGITSWPQALLKWVLSATTRCHVAIPATSHRITCRECRGGRSAMVGTG